MTRLLTAFMAIAILTGCASESEAQDCVPCVVSNYGTPAAIEFACVGAAIDTFIACQANGGSFWACIGPALLTFQQCNNGQAATLRQRRAIVRGALQAWRSRNQASYQVQMAQVNCCGGAVRVTPVRAMASKIKGRLRIRKRCR